MTSDLHPELAGHTAAARPFSGLAAVVALGLNIVAGLIVALVLVYADTPTRIALTVAILAVVSLVALTSMLVYKLRTTTRQLGHLKEMYDSSSRHYKEQLAAIGVADVQTLDQSEWRPSAIMDRAHHEVRFVGVFGRKWVSEADLVERFRAMLTRIQLNGGRAQFLLLDPSGQASRDIAKFRRQKGLVYADFPSINVYRQLAAQFDCFRIRLYDTLPIFRLVFVDGRCAVSRYKIHAPEAEAWKAPHAVFLPDSPDGRWTFYQPFSLFFDLLWDGFGQEPPRLGTDGDDSPAAAASDTLSPSSP